MRLYDSLPASVLVNERCSSLVFQVNSMVFRGLLLNKYLSDLSVFTTDICFATALSL